FAWKRWRQMVRYADWAHAWPAAAVGNAKCFMQIQMANVGAVIARTTQTALGVHIRAVHEDLAVMRMHDVTDFADRRFEHAMCRMISHHQRSYIARLFICFCMQ